MSHNIFHQKKFSSGICHKILGSSFAQEDDNAEKYILARYLPFIYRDIRKKDVSINLTKKKKVFSRAFINVIVIKKRGQTSIMMISLANTYTKKGMGSPYLFLFY